MTDLHTTIQRNDIVGLKEFLSTLSVLDHEQLCFVAKSASPEALELCLPFANPDLNQSEVLVWGLKNTANPTRQKDIFNLLRGYCDVHAAIHMLKTAPTESLSDYSEKARTAAHERLSVLESQAQKDFLASTVRASNQRTDRPRRM